MAQEIQPEPSRVRASRPGSRARFLPDPVSGHSDKVRFHLCSSQCFPHLHFCADTAMQQDELEHQEEDTEQAMDGRERQMVRARKEGGTLVPLAASSQAVQGSELMQSATSADSALLLGGDLLVSVWQARRLQGAERTTHPFARVRVGEESQLTSVQWQTVNPSWDETLNFRY